MEDMFAKLQEILNSKEGQEQLKNVAQMFGGADANTSTQTDEPSQNEQGSGGGGFDFSNIDMGMLMQLQGLMSNAGKNDDDTRLLQALKPHLSEKRQGKVDTAVKILQLLTVLPLIKDSGLLGGLFSSGSK